MRNTTAKLQGLSQNLISFVRQGEFRTAGHVLSETLRTCLYHHMEYIVFTRSLDAPLPGFEARLPATFRVARLADLPYLRAAVSPAEFHYMSKRLAHGRICILALCQDGLMAYAWASKEINFEIDNLELELDPGDAYINNIYTLPPYRRQHIQIALHLHQLQYLNEWGFKRSVAIVDRDNIPSQKMFEKLGYQKTGCLSFRRIFLKRHYRYHNGQC